MVKGFILQKLSGNGIAFAEFDGHVIEYELQPGQQIVIDTGHLAAMTATCQMDIQTVPGIKKSCSSVVKDCLTLLLQVRAMYGYRQCLFQIWQELLSHTFQLLINSKTPQHSESISSDM